MKRGVIRWPEKIGVVKRNRLISMCQAAYTKVPIAAWLPYFYQNVIVFGGSVKEQICAVTFSR